MQRFNINSGEILSTVENLAGLIASSILTDPESVIQISNQVRKYHASVGLLRSIASAYRLLGNEPKAGQAEDLIPAASQSTDMEIRAKRVVTKAIHSRDEEAIRLSILLLLAVASKEAAMLNGLTEQEHGSLLRDSETYGQIVRGAGPIQNIDLNDAIHQATLSLAA